MPMQLAPGAFSTGRDVSLVLIHQLVGQVDMPNVTNFDAKPNMTTIGGETRLDGQSITIHVPKNWSITFDLERGSQALDNLHNLIEAGWYGPGAVPLASLYHHIAELDGSSSTYLYASISLYLANPGAWGGDKPVKQQVMGTGRTRVSV